MKLDKLPPETRQKKAVQTGLRAVFSQAIRRKANEKARLRFLASGLKVEAAGIAPEVGIPQVCTAHDSCVEHQCQWLHYVCRDAALRELVTNWHRLSPSVRTTILGLTRGS